MNTADALIYNQSNDKLLTDPYNGDNEVPGKSLTDLAYNQRKPTNHIEEFENEGHSPTMMVGISLGTMAIGVVFIIIAACTDCWPLCAITGVCFLGPILFIKTGFYTVETNTARVLTLCGEYKGTARTPGLSWANCCYKKTTVDLGMRNFETERIKVNDKNGTPVLVQAVVTYHVKDTAQALFQMQDYTFYLRKQAIAALRELCTQYDYDNVDPNIHTLSNSKVEVAEKLKVTVQSHLDFTGVEVIDARISELTYAPEIAAQMLKRQQAQAIIAARSKVVEGAVGMAVDAIEKITSKDIAKLESRHK